MQGVLRRVFLRIPNLRRRAPAAAGGSRGGPLEAGAGVPELGPVEGDVVILPRSLWPGWQCDELGAAGWQAKVIARKPSGHKYKCQGTVRVEPPAPGPAAGAG